MSALEVDIRQPLPPVVAHDIAGLQFLDRPGRREAVADAIFPYFLVEHTQNVDKLTSDGGHLRRGQLGRDYNLRTMLLRWWLILKAEGIKVWMPAV